MYKKHNINLNWQERIINYHIQADPVKWMSNGQMTFDIRHNFDHILSYKLYSSMILHEWLESIYKYLG